MLRGRTNGSGQPTPTSPPRPPYRPKQRPTAVASLAQWVWLLAGISVFIFCCLLALAVVFGILQARNDHRYERSRTDFDQIRDAVEPIGFLARKRSSQTIPVNVFTRVTGWVTSAGVPAYDVSDGAFDTTTGVWTTRIPGKYQVSASICWTNGALGLRQILLVTNGTGSTTPVSSEVAAIGLICNTLSVNMDLSQDLTVEVQALRTTAGIEVVNAFSTFGIERIGSNVAA